VPYQRTAVVERQLAEALAMDAPQLVQCAQVRDTSHAAFLDEEALVALIRFFQAEGDGRLVDDLARALLERATGFIRARLHGLRDAALEEQAYLDVVADLFDQVLDLGSDRGDFFQVRFWVALRTLAIGVARKYVTRQRRDRQTQSLDAPVGGGAEGEDGPMIDLPDPAIPVDRRLAYREALHLIPEPQRIAFIMRYYEDWPIEDRDPTVPTISRHFNRSSRMIRYWLKEAEAILERWREEGR
jgi:DNA-directed RNA polymerase specialized sigma24 family protein